MITRRTFLQAAAVASAATARPSGVAHAAEHSGGAGSVRYKVAADLRRIRVSYDDGRRWFHSLTLPATAQLVDIQRSADEDRLVVSAGSRRFKLRSTDGRRWWSLREDRLLPRTGDEGNWIGQIVPVGFTFAPRDWAFCDGNLLSTDQFPALFSLIGTIYGGDGRTTFALPDLRGRTALHFGTGPGLSSRLLGSKGGSETNTLNTSQLPSHSHPATSQALAAAGRGDSDEPAGRTWAADGAYASYGYSNGVPSQPLNATAISTTIGTAGGGESINNMQPYLTIAYVIALDGIFPSRN